jgi:hypothetical protein
MESSELEAVRLQVRRAYELGRARRALLVLIPILALAWPAWRVGGDARGPVLAGGLLSLVGVAFLWRGKRAGGVVLPAMFAGALPFGCGLWAHCAVESRFGLCVFACLAGGVAAGFLVARFAQRSDARGETWAYAGTVAILTGSVGCACVGLGGLVGLVVGLGVVALPALLTPARASS